MNRPPYPSLTAVVHGMVKAAPSGLDARTVADLVGKPYAPLMSELSQQPGHKLGAELLLPLMDVCESDLPLVFLARQRGGAFVPLRLPDDGPVQLVTGLSVSIREFGEFAVAAAEQIADGKITKESTMSQELYAKPAAPVKTASYLVRLRGLPPQRLSMTHRALLAFLQQAGQRRAAAVA